jgi:DNA repair exonuclease SbcCD ATPase subunit
MPSERLAQGDVIRNAFRTLESRLSLLSEKISMIEKNEEVIGRTLLGLNDKVKRLEGRGEAGGGGGGISSEELSELRDELNEVRERLKEVESVVSMINPLEYARIDEVKKLVEEKIGGRAERPAAREREFAGGAEAEEKGREAAVEMFQILRSKARAEKRRSGKPRVARGKKKKRR